MSMTTEAVSLTGALSIGAKDSSMEESGSASVATTPSPNRRRSAPPPVCRRNSGGPIPETLPEVTVPFVQHALRVGGMLSEGVTLEAIRMEPTDVQGLLSSTGRVHITYTGSDGMCAPPASAIVKMQAEHEGNRATALAADNYVMEAKVYKFLAKELPIGVPCCFYVAEDEASGNCVFVLEDLCLRPGIHCISQFDAGGCGQERAEAVASMLGKLHGHYWSWSEQLPAWLRPVSRIEARNVEQVTAENSDAYHASAYYTGLDSISRAAVDRVAARIPQIAEAVAAGPQTLLHLDVRADNLFWGDEQAVGGVVLLDWQMVGQGVGALDLAWFAASSFLEPGETDRVARDQRLVEVYWQSLVEAGVDADRYPFEAAWRDYLLGIAWTWLILWQAVKFPACDALTIWLRRATAALVELGACDIPLRRLF